MSSYLPASPPLRLCTGRRENLYQVICGGVLHQCVCAFVLLWACLLACNAVGACLISMLLWACLCACNAADACWLHPPLQSSYITCTRACMCNALFSSHPPFIARASHAHANTHSMQWTRPSSITQAQKSSTRYSKRSSRQGWGCAHGAWRAPMVHGAWCMVHGAWCMVHGAWRAPMVHGVHP